MLLRVLWLLAGELWQCEQVIVIHQSRYEKVLHGFRESQQQQALFVDEFRGCSQRYAVPLSCQPSLPPVSLCIVSSHLGSTRQEPGSRDTCSLDCHTDAAQMYECDCYQTEATRDGVKGSRV